ncbi:MAG: hypothetical protein IKB03_01760 [Tidjanibacter sp.]|nr:hypothetical protein [Tidjanibacter sp.]
MKKIFRFAALLMAAAAMFMVGCEEPTPPAPVDPFEGASLEVNLVGADINVATFSIKAEVLKVASYIVKPFEANMTAPTAAEIFEQGTLVALEEGAAQVTLRDLTPETSYKVYAAGRISSDKVWDTVAELKFTTAAEPIIPVLTAKFESATATSADYTIYAENISRIAYIAAPATDALDATIPSIQVIFATGKVANLVQGDNTLTVNNLSPNTEYILYIAGEIAGIEEYMEEVLVVKGAKTSDFAEDITVRDINYRGFTIDVKVDPKVKEQNHVIKWATSDLYMYNKNAQLDTDAMNLHDTAWGGINLFNESRSLIIDEAHSYIYNSNGELESWYFESIVPGQPQVVIMGEYRRGESEWGWGYGYYRPMFDRDQYIIDQTGKTERLDEAPYWSGFYQHLNVQVQHPEPLPEDMLLVEIDAEPDDALIKVTADKSLEQVVVMVMSELEYNSAMTMIEDKHLPWFATSMVGMYEGVSMSVDPHNEEMGLNGTFMTAISQFLLDIPRESKFWVYVIGLRGDFNNDGFLDGHEQICKEFEFYLPQPTKPAPKIEVTALESTSAFEVGFNIKCPTKDADRGKTIANYEKEWLMAGMSAQEIVDNYGIEFTSIELARINSDEGLTITYPSRPNEKTYLAAMVANDEGTETFSEAVIAKSLNEPAADRVESELFESLKGEWTASATVTYSMYNTETEVYDPYTVVHSCNVTIGDVEYPEELREEDYQTFERHGVNRETAALYYNEFKAAAATFNENTRAQNRILMNGYNFAGEIQPYFQYSDPYSLFVSDTYNGYTSEMPLYDFGPKWYLEVAADGTVTAPFNTNYFTPMASWYTERNAVYESHFIAYEPTTKLPVGYMGDEAGNAVNGHFPVEISEDGNTITVKPFEYSGYKFYPNAAINYGGGQYSITVAVISEVVLTRNNSSAVAAKAIRKPAGQIKNQMVQADQKIEAPARPASRAAIGEKVEFKMVEGIQHLSGEERAKLWFENRRK